MNVRAVYGGRMKMLTFPITTIRNLDDSRNKRDLKVIDGTMRTVGTRRKFRQLSMANQEPSR